MTIQEIRASKKEMLRPADICPSVIPVTPETFLHKAKKAPETLPFPVFVMGRYVYIPRIALLNFFEGKIKDQGK